MLITKVIAILLLLMHSINVTAASKSFIQSEKWVKVKDLKPIDFGSCGNEHDASAVAQAFEYFHNRNYKKSRFYIKKCAESGYKVAQVFLASMYLYGRGEVKSIEKYKYWINRATQNNPEMMLVVSNYFESGKYNVFNKDKNAGIYWLTRATASGYVPAIESLGSAELYGLKSLVKRPNVKRGLALLDKAARRGSGKAMCKIADAYENGRSGLVKNQEFALKLYEQAALNGDIWSARKIFLMSQFGLISNNTFDVSKLFIKKELATEKFLESAALSCDGLASYLLYKSYINSGKSLSEQAREANFWYWASRSLGFSRGEVHQFDEKEIFLSPKYEKIKACVDSKYVGDCELIF